MRTARHLVVALALLASSTSCSLGRDKEVAETAVFKFHNQFNAGRFTEIYNQSGFRESVRDTEFVALMESLQRKLGTAGVSSPGEWHVTTSTSGSTVSLQYQTEFTNGKATETFVFGLNGDRAVLNTYNVSSPLLLSK